MNMYIGTYSDETVIELLKKNYDKRIFEYVEGKGRCLISDAEIKSKIIDAGCVKGGITQFFAKDLSAAFTTAKEMGLKNFSQVSERIYEKGKDYK